MVAGAPFPDLLDWTWGEILEYIKCKREQEKEDLRTQALMLFRQASLISRMVSSNKGDKFDVMDEFSFLWSEEDKSKARAARLKAQMLARSKRKKGR